MEPGPREITRRGSSSCSQDRTISLPTSCGSSTIVVAAIQFSAGTNVSPCRLDTTCVPNARPAPPASAPRAGVELRVAGLGAEPFLQRLQELIDFARAGAGGSDGRHRARQIEAREQPLHQ